MRQRVMPKVAVQIPAWNQCEELVDCLNSLKKVKYPNLEVIVINNGEDNTSEVVKRDFKWVTLIEEGIDLGFCRANNIGFRYCLKKKFDYILLLNGDTKIFSETIEKLLNVMQNDPSIAIAGAKNILMENPAYMWGQYGKVTWGPMLVSTAGRFKPDLHLSQPPVDVDWVICNGCMIRCSVLKEIGLFDENYWMSDEDVEWSFRARRNGYRTIYVDSAAILHKGSSSTNVKNKTKVFSYGYFLGRNPILFAKKYAGLHQKVWLFFNIFVGLLSRIIYALILILNNAFRLFLRYNYNVLHNMGSNILNEARSNRYFIRGVIDGIRDEISHDYIYIEIKRKSVPEEKPAPVRTFKNGYMDKFRRWMGY